MSEELKIMVNMTEREVGQLMVLLDGEVPHKPGFNMTEREQIALMQKCRTAVWQLYHIRKGLGLPTELDKTGVLEPKDV